MKLEQIKKNIKYGDYNILQKLLKTSSVSVAKRKFLSGDKEALDAMMVIQENRTIFPYLHDELYEFDGLVQALKNKADLNHRHDISDINNLSAVLDKVEYLYIDSERKVNVDGSNASGNLKDAVDNRHSHSNKIVLDNLKQKVIDDSHTHTNKALLDTYNQTNANISDAVSLKHTHTNKNVLDGVSAAKVSNWDAASVNTHTHANKTVLDNVTQGVIDNNHNHTNKALLDSYNQTNVNITDAVSLKHNHSNKAVLDAITESFKTVDKKLLDALGGLQFESDQANAILRIKDGNGALLTSISLAYLNNEGTKFTYNTLNKMLELRNDSNELLSSIPVSNFVTNLVSNANWNGTTPTRLDFKDNAGSVLFSIDYTVTNIQGLQGVLDVLTNNIGNLASLTTTHTTDLVGAINEVHINSLEKQSVGVVNDCNDATLGRTLIQPSTLNIPQAGMYGELVTTQTSTWIFQILYDTNGRIWKRRNINSGGWQPWVLIADNTNVGSYAWVDGANTTGGNWNIQTIQSTYLASGNNNNGQVFYATNTSDIYWGNPELNYHRFQGKDANSMLYYTPTLGYGLMWNEHNMKHYNNYGLSTDPTLGLNIDTDITVTRFIGVVPWTSGTLPFAYGNILNMSYANGAEFSQIAVAQGQDVMAFRNKDGSGTLRPWRTVVHDGNVNTYINNAIGGNYVPYNGANQDVFLNSRNLYDVSRIRTILDGNSEEWNYAYNNKVWAISDNEGDAPTNFDNLPKQTYMGCIADNNSDWWSVWNIQHRNGRGGDGHLWGTQFRVGMVGSLDKLQYRSLYNGTYGNWADIIHSGNIASYGFLTNANLNGYATQSWVQSQGYLTSANLSNYVTLNSTQSITGTKTFTQSPVIPNATANTHAVNLSQLNAKANNNNTITINGFTQTLGNNPNFTVSSSGSNTSRQYDFYDPSNEDFTQYGISSAENIDGLEVAFFNPDKGIWDDIFGGGGSGGAPVYKNIIFSPFTQVCVRNIATGNEVVNGTIEVPFDPNPYIDERRFHLCLVYTRNPNNSDTYLDGYLSFISATDIVNIIGSGSTEMFNKVYKIGYLTRNKTLVVNPDFL